MSSSSRVSMRIESAWVAAALLLPVWAAVPRVACSESPVIAINEDAAKSEITTQSLRNGVAVLMGSGGNIGVMVGPEGAFMVDAGIAVSKDRLASALSRLGVTAPKYVVDTHYHWDHTDGNAWLHRAGALIVGHPNTLQRLSTTTRVEDWSYTFPPADKDGLPSELVSAERTWKLGGETITARYYGKSHTDSDLSVYFERANVLFTGDTWWNGYYPFIDNAAGGSINGMIQAAEWNIQRSKPDTIIVPGHGPVGRKGDLVEYRNMLVAIRDRVRELKSKGASLEDVSAASPSAAFDKKWGAYVIDPKFFQRLVYAGL